MLYYEIQRRLEGGLWSNPWGCFADKYLAVRGVISAGTPALYAVFVQGGFVPTYDAAFYIEIVEGPGGNYVDPDIPFGPVFEQIVWECGDPMRSYRAYSALPAPNSYSEALADV